MINDIKKQIDDLVRDCSNLFSKVEKKDIHLIEEFYINDELVYEVLISSEKDYYFYFVRNDNNGLSFCPVKITTSFKEYQLGEQVEIKNNNLKKEIIKESNLKDLEYLYELFGLDKLGLKSHLSDNFNNIILENIKSAFNVQKIEKEKNKEIIKIEVDEGTFFLYDYHNLAYTEKEYCLPRNRNGSNYLTHDYYSRRYLYGDNDRFKIEFISSKNKKVLTKNIDPLVFKFFIQESGDIELLHESMSGEYYLSRGEEDSSYYSSREICKNDLSVCMKDFIDKIFQKGLVKKKVLYKNEVINKGLLLTSEESVKLYNEEVLKFSRIKLNYTEQDDAKSILMILKDNENTYLKKKKIYENIIKIVSDIKNNQKIDDNLKFIILDNFSKIDEILNVDAQNLVLLRKRYDLISQQYLNEKLSKLLKIEENLLEKRKEIYNK